MMDGMRKAGKSVVGRIVIAILFGFLIFSFALWGIGDIFRGYGTRTVASVGGTTIDVEPYRQAFQSELQQLSRRYGRNITTEQAVMAGIDRQVLNRMMAEATYDEIAHQYKLGLPDDKLAAMVTSDPAFAGTDGKFDRQRFNDLIRQAGYTEQRFMNEQRSVALRQQIAQAVGGVPHSPATMRDALNHYAHEERKIRYFTFGEKDLDPIATPADDVLKAYFDENKDSFKLPEYRSFVAIALRPSDLADVKSISDADAKAEFERLKDQLGTPERRVVRQLVFLNADDAKAASEKIKSGKTFSEIAAERNLKDADTDLGLVTQKDIVDKTVAEAVFKLSKDQISDVIAGKFGYVIATVSDIQPGKPVAYQDVADKIKMQLALKNVKGTIRDLHDKIEDQRATAKPLDTIAKELNISLKRFDAVDRAGRDKTKANVEAIPEKDALIKSVFSSDIGVDNETLTTSDGGYVWFDVTGIIPARDQSYDEAKKDVEDAWRRDETAKALETKAQSIVTELNAHKSIDLVAKAFKRDVKQADRLTRMTRNADVPQPVLTKAFNVPVKAAESAFGATASERIIFVVENSNLPAAGATAVDIGKIETELKANIADDYTSVYILSTQNELGVKVNEAIRNQAIGAN